jgi:hypothetical protein
MSKAAFASAVSSDVHWENEVAHVFFESKRFMTQAEVNSQPEQVRQMIQRGETQNYFDVDISLTATFRNGKLVELSSWKIESM